MIEQTPLTLSPTEVASNMIDLLERHRQTLPFADTEIARHRALLEALEEQHRRGEQALSAWREALSRRWECEVNGQRVYTAIQRQISDYFGKDATYTQLVAPANPGAAQTASDLLANMRRLEASLALLKPRPPFVDEWLVRLGTAGTDLAAAIDCSDHCESERRNVLIERRMAANLYERTCQKTRRLLSEHIGDAAILTWPSPVQV